MKRNVEDVELLKEEILRVSEEVFSEKGYQETKMTDIAERLHISRGPLYYHYKNKSELFTATVEYHMRNLLEDVKKIFAPQREKRMLDVFMEDLHHRVKTLDFATSARYAISNGGEAMRQAQQNWDTTLQDIYQIKLKAVQGAQRRGELREGITPEHCVKTLFVLYGGIREIKVELDSIYHNDSEMYHKDVNTALGEMERYMRLALFR